MQINPIETIYKGYRFRSRLEARWAVFFDALNQKWEYEREGYLLEDGSRYLPDFWLPILPRVNTGQIVEIKPTEPNDVERTKLLLLSKGTEMPVFCFWGIPGGSGEWHATYYRRGECRMKDGVFMLDNCPHKLLDSLLCFLDHDKICPVPFDYIWHTHSELWKIDSLRRAFKSFKSARFEFGEQG